jgi:hypothetical protein
MATKARRPATTRQSLTIATPWPKFTSTPYIDGTQVKPSGSDDLKFKQETITNTLRNSSASWKDSDANPRSRILFN